MGRKPRLSLAQHRAVARLLQRERTELRELYRHSVVLYPKESRWLTCLQQARKYLDELYALGEAELFSTQPLFEMDPEEVSTRLSVYERTDHEPTREQFLTEWRNAQPQEHV